MVELRDSSFGSIDERKLRYILMNHLLPHDIGQLMKGQEAQQILDLISAYVSQVLKENGIIVIIQDILKPQIVFLIL